VPALQDRSPQIHDDRTVRGFAGRQRRHVGAGMHEKTNTCQMDAGFFDGLEIRDDESRIGKSVEQNLMTVRCFVISALCDQEFRLSFIFLFFIFYSRVPFWYGIGVTES
jgi:hypothetical protein